jgi:hypothetical protein
MKSPTVQMRRFLVWEEGSRAVAYPVPGPNCADADRRDTVDRHKHERHV